MAGPRDRRTQTSRRPWFFSGPGKHSRESQPGTSKERRRLAGSLIGGIAETQEMLDYCAEHGIVCDIEKIAIDKINEAYERMLKSDVKYRFVIDMASLN